jgi:hypothetical protein
VVESLPEGGICLEPREISCESVPTSRPKPFPDNY